MTEPTLFDMPPQPPPVVKRLSTDARRTARQALAVSRGIHPLALVLGGGVWMHPQASRQANRTDGQNLPLRCGSCQWRQLWSVGVRKVPKCGWVAPATTGLPRYTSSVASDVRAWWPACTDYEPRVKDEQT